MLNSVMPITRPIDRRAGAMSSATSSVVGGEAVAVFDIEGLSAGRQAALGVVHREPRSLALGSRGHRQAS
jgi:hypothetical protein